MIDFNFLNVKVLKLSKIKLKKHIKQLILAEAFNLGDVSVVFCSDEYLIEINKKYLNHNYYTDIITFDYSNNSILNGDLYISIDRVLENSKIFKSDFNNEIIRVVFHGILHLCKFKDKSTSDKIIMKSKENEYLNIFFNN